MMKYEYELHIYVHIEIFIPFNEFVIQEVLYSY